MSLWELKQKRDEINELKRRNEIEAEKLRVMQQGQQNKQSKQVFCPHYGKSFTIEV